jgi:hypothetical protein
VTVSRLHVRVVPEAALAVRVVPKSYEDRAAAGGIETRGAQIEASLKVAVIVAEDALRIVADAGLCRSQRRSLRLFDPPLLLRVRSTPMTSSGAAGSQPDSAQAVAVTPAMHASRIAGAALRPARASTITPRSWSVTLALRCALLGAQFPESVRSQ